MMDAEDAEEIEAGLFRVCAGKTTFYIDRLGDVLTRLALCDDVDETQIPFWTEEMLRSGTALQKEFLERDTAMEQELAKVNKITSTFRAAAASGADQRFVTRCSKCGATGDDVQEVDAQTRAADEGTSVLGLCLKCGHRWKS